MICCLFLPLLFTVTVSSGSPTVQWEVLAPRQVNGTERNTAILPCSFSHPTQDTYTGQIRVLWKKDHPWTTEPFFQCSLTNSTGAAGDECSRYVAAGRFFLSGDPRHRDLSLLVKDLRLNDSGVYFCRVELDQVRESYQSKAGTKLSVTAPAHIVSLSQMPFPDNSTLECVAVGSPPPKITWFSSSKGQVQAVDKNNPQDPPYTIRNSIHISSQEVYTCQAENTLGSQVRVFPPRKGPKPLTVWLSVLVGLVLLAGVVAALLWMKRGGASLKVDIRSFKNRGRQKTGASDTNGDQELVYADIDHSPNPNAYTVPSHGMQNDIIYSDVN